LHREKGVKKICKEKKSHGNEKGKDLPGGVGAKGGVEKFTKKAPARKGLTVRERFFFKKEGKGPNRENWGAR